MTLNVANIQIIINISICLLFYTSAFPNNKDVRHLCPHLYEKTFHGCLPRANITAGVYEEIVGITKLKQCVLECCTKLNCNVILMNQDKCYHVACTSNEMCIPESRKNAATEGTTMILVKPVNDETWEDALSAQDSEDSFTRRFEDIYQDLIMDGSTFNYRVGDAACEVGIDTNCNPNEYCHPNRIKSRAGTCICRENFYRNPDGNCVNLVHALDQSPPQQFTERIVTVIPTTNRKRLTIDVANQEVRLPKNDVTLVAHVTPSDDEHTEKYRYDWTSLEQPAGSTAVKDQNGGQLHLSKLTEGMYTFKVIISDSNAYGETYVNVTVLPPSRVNRPPVILIIPANQTIKQPNTAAVLDASSSTDDDGIVGWHWELQQGPLGYQPKLKDTPTLQLNDLTKPGNYTFKLTVTDTDKASSSSTANVTVLKFTDYPPDANGGEDKIIYLPRNRITLNGNLSIDDHAITTWEWTKSPDDAQKAVDMQDTRTPYLQLSNLEEGMYTFVLKVTDSANQTSSAQVHVFVKPPTNRPPTADAGHNLTINLPQTWTLLDATNSTDDDKIVAYHWECLDGPNRNVRFANASAVQTNVTGLTKGTYTFRVNVSDENANMATALVIVDVVQTVNQKPKAMAGPDFVVELPQNVVRINGNQSTDDWRIVRWEWKRDGRSLALGKIAEGTDHESVLMLTDLIPGRYVFNLTVYDEQGLSDTDMVEFTVKIDPKLFYLIEITIDFDVRLLTIEQYDTLISKLALLVGDGKLQVREIKPEIGTGKTTIVFYVESNAHAPISANQIVYHLRQKLHVDLGLLGFDIIKLQTTICQNNCSGHGVCNEKTRLCECEAFWMRDMFKVYLKSDEDSDCSWSILYVVLGVICSVIAFLGSLWGLVYICYTWCNRRSTVLKTNDYKRIENIDEPPAFGKKGSGGAGGGGGNLSDTDSDSDVVFEARKPTTRFADVRNGLKASRNGGIKASSRRIKT